jgi:hypothetical protein
VIALVVLGIVFVLILFGIAMALRDFRTPRKIECPFCFEPIRLEAVKCPHCQSSLLERPSNRRR